MFTFSAFNLLWFYHFEKVNILILTHNILYRQKTADIDVYNEGASSSADVHVTASLTSTQCIATQAEETFCSTAVEQFCSTAVEQSSNGQNLEAEIEEIINSDYAGNVEIDMELDSENSTTSSSESDESEEEEYKKDSEIPESESVPLYVLSFSDSIYSSEITHKEHLLSLCAFSTKNHLSRTAFQQLLKLIDILLPEKKCETSVNKIKEKVGFHGSYFQCHEYCDTCGALYPNDKLIHQCTTPRCTGMRCDTKDGKSNYFVSGDMRTELKEILENEENWNEVTSSLQRTKKDEIYDILD